MKKKSNNNDQKINDIIRHIKKVEDNCNLLARHIYAIKPYFALNLIQRGRLHDLSKFEQLEFDHLNKKSSQFKHALRNHHELNSHHPEHFVEGIRGMTDLDLAEMCCDWVARSQEFVSDVRKYAFGQGTSDAPKRYNYNKGDEVWERIEYYLNILTTEPFNKKNNE